MENKNKNKKLRYKENRSTIAELVSIEVLTNLFELKAHLEAKEVRRKHIENKKKYKGEW